MARRSFQSRLLVMSQGKIGARGLQLDMRTEVLDGKLQMITQSWVIATKGQQSEKCVGLDGADIIQ